jgi:hypothetical protein
MLSARAVPRSYKEENWGNQVSSVQEAVKKGDSWKRVRREPPFREGLSTEAEEWSLLEAVNRQLLVKTPGPGKDFT